MKTGRLVLITFLGLLIGGCGPDVDDADVYDYAHRHRDADIIADPRRFADSQGHGDAPTNVSTDPRTDAYKGGANRDVYHCLR
jgi:hypothetical protein